MHLFTIPGIICIIQEIPMTLTANQYSQTSKVMNCLPKFCYDECLLVRLFTTFLAPLYQSPFNIHLTHSGSVCFQTSDLHERNLNQSFPLLTLISYCCSLGMDTTVHSNRVEILDHLIPIRALACDLWLCLSQSIKLSLILQHCGWNDNIWRSNGGQVLAVVNFHHST